MGVRTSRTFSAKKGVTMSVISLDSVGRQYIEEHRTKTDSAVLVEYNSTNRGLQTMNSIHLHVRIGWKLTNSKLAPVPVLLQL